MSVRPESRRAGTRRRRESGQGTLEYVGVVLVAALLVGAVVSAVAPDSVRTAVACHIRSIVDQSGSCGSDVPPTEYDPDGGVTATAPESDGGTTSTTPDAGGGSGTPSTSYDGADLGPPVPPDEATVTDGIDTFDDKLDGGWNGVRSGELEDIEAMLGGLTGPELDAVIAEMSDDQLRHWVDELDDGWIGSGWSRERRREMWSMIASKASPATMRRIASFTDEVQPAFDDVGGDDAADDPDSPANDAEYTEVPHQLVVDGVSPEDLAQGQIGDCWLIASMAAIANTDPGRIEDLIQRNPNGTYTVTLYDDGEPVAVTVTADIPTIDDDPVFVDNASGESVHELWPHVLEKAAAQYYGDYEDIEGDWPSKALELFDGTDVDTYDGGWFSGPDPPSVDSISDTLDDGGAVLVSTDHENRNELYEDGTIVQGHAYYVLDVHDDGTVVLANPWGLDRYEPIELTEHQFRDSFIRYDVADPED